MDFERLGQYEHREDGRHRVAPLDVTDGSWDESDPGSERQLAHPSVVAH